MGHPSGHRPRIGLILRAAHLLKVILSRPYSVEDLVVNELRAHRVLSGIMPGGEEFLPEVYAPGRLALALAPLSGQLLALGHSVHHMVRATAQGPELRPELGAEGVNSGYMPCTNTDIFPLPCMWKSGPVMPCVGQEATLESTCQVDSFLSFSLCADVHLCVCLWRSQADGNSSLISLHLSF